MTTQALENFENMNAQALAAVEGGNIFNWWNDHPAEAALISSWAAGPVTGVIGTGIYNGYNSTR